MSFIKIILLKIVKNPLTVITLIGVTGIVAYNLGGKFNSTVKELTTIDTVRIERQLIKNDTIRIYQPYQVTVYDTVKSTRTDTIRVAENFAYRGLVNNNPVTRNRNSLTLTTFDLDTQSFMQRTYKLPKKTWEFSGFVSTGLYSDFRTVSLEMSLRYKNVSLVPTIGLISTNMKDLRFYWGTSLKYSLPL